MITYCIYIGPDEAEDELKMIPQQLPESEHREIILIFFFKTDTFTPPTFLSSESPLRGMERGTASL